MSGFEPAFLSATSSSFFDLVSGLRPDALPTPGHAGAGVPEGTTVLALTTAEGVLMAGDRRATAGHQIAHRRIEKVHRADAESVIGIAGTAGLSLELIRLFQLELEHYEKIEGTPLSLEGKANRLAAMLRTNLGLALQGLAVVPLFAGAELAGADSPGAEPTARAPRGRIFSFDVTGGKYEEVSWHAIGSGSGPARSALKRLWAPALETEAAAIAALEALADAAEDDAGTGGADLVHGIAPVIRTVGPEGERRLDEAYVLDLAAAVVERRRAGAANRGEAAR
ncbi:proteasome subunit beta [Brevibacterium album]|uniref:proteasome subunit beta n=1 Tax=Brevibacterium album TaxID=417948 RepID=UPI00041AA174|nr:proteasome subunit beta [Brevibacterium album]